MGAMVAQPLLNTGYTGWCRTGQHNNPTEAIVIADGRVTCKCECHVEENDPQGFPNK